MINLPAGRVANDQAVALQEAFGLFLLVYPLGHRPLFNVYTIIKLDLLSKPPPITTAALGFCSLECTFSHQRLHRAPPLNRSTTLQTVYDCLKKKRNQCSEYATLANSPSFSFASFLSIF